ncbi:MAG: hypothetical protein HKP24_00945 [Croceitalea sp.]|nr:hypothetical protein [Croceitalea sp.]
MARYLAFLFVFLSSCKSLMHNDRLISYELIYPLDILIQTVGDFQEIQIDERNSVRVMPAYFREWRGLENNIIVIISIDSNKLLADEPKVTSKIFGPMALYSLKTNTHKMTYTYSIDLKEVELVARKNKILADTLSITVRNQTFQFSPKTISKDRALEGLR